LYALFVFSIVLLAYLEGLQVAILALEKVDPSFFQNKPRAYKAHMLATAHRGLNVQRFLVGRQFFVVFVVFLSAQLTTYTSMPLDALPRWLFIVVIETGLPGALVVLAFGQLMPQLIAATHPVAFMNLPGSLFVIRLALVFAALGITHFSWVLSAFVKWCCSLTSQERRPPRRLVGSLADDDDDNKKASFLAHEKMSVEVLDADQLYSGAQRGMESAEQSAVSSREMATWVKDQACQNMFQKWGVKHDHETVAELPTPSDIVRSLVSKNEPVPRYLLPPYHPKHIPPHIVAFEMLRRDEVSKRAVQELRQQNAELKQMIASLQPQKVGARGGRRKGVRTSSEAEDETHAGVDEVGGLLSEVVLEGVRE
jgi:hypothetical protein